MQSRKLRKLLNDTGYTVHFRGNKVCIGSPMCSELITVDAETYQMKYALDTFREGRKAIRSQGLGFIWDKLEELIKNGELKSIIENNDSTEGMFPVYCCDDGEITQKFTDVFGWPNSAHDGTLMYGNTFFRTEREAIEYGIKDLTAAVEMYSERIADVEKELIEKKTTQERYAGLLKNLTEKRIG